MKLYIDLEHLKSLAKSVIGDSEMNRLIRENLDIYYTFDKTDLSNPAKVKRQKKIDIDNWHKNLSTGRNGKQIYYNSSIPLTESILETHNIKDFPQEDLQSIFFIKENTILPKGLLSCELGNELSTLRSLLINDKCIPAKIYYTRPEEKEEIHKWDIIARNVSPCTDIIINDLYMFTQKQSDCEYESNSYKLIEELCEQSKGVCLNIVIITRKCYYNDEKIKKQDGIYESKAVEYQIPIASIKRRLKEITKEVTGQEANITIIAQENDHRVRRIHDRAIFTNYKLFLSGDSFKYYKDETKDGNTTTTFESRGIWLGVCSLFDDEHIKIAKRFLKDVQDIVNESEKRIGCIIDGERMSNFLLFKQKTIEL